MIRYVSAILLLCAFAIQSFNSVFIVISYYANTASFSKDCVNRFRPQLHCDGKCVMMKKMIEAEKKDQQSPQPKLEIKYDVFTSESTSSPAFDSPATGNEKIVASSACTSSAGFLASIFHPPAAC